MKKLLAYVRSQFRRLLELRDTPHAVAGGVAIGVFYGFTPLFGVKTLLCLATAWLARCSKIAAVIAVSLHDLVWPFLPFLLRIQFDIGYWILSNPHRLPPRMAMHEVKIHSLLNWGTISNLIHWLLSRHGGLPLLVGSIVLAIPAMIVAYVVTFQIMKRRQLRPLRAEG